MNVTADALAAALDRGRLSWDPTEDPAPLNRPLSDIDRIEGHWFGSAILAEVRRRGIDSILRSVERTHEDDEEWSDIFYNGAIDPTTGDLIECRPAGRRSGAHAGDAWTVLIPIGVGDEPTAEEWENIRLGLEKAWAMLGYAPDALTDHGRSRPPSAASECPGPEIRLLIDQMKEATMPRTPKDNTPPKWAATAIDAAKAADISDGSRPNDPATRAEVIVIAMRVLDAAAEAAQEAADRAVAKSAKDVAASAAEASEAAIVKALNGRRLAISTEATILAE